nr:reverse transcriptase domain-containing protein [Tanacetum cinerariifolium]
MRLKGFASWVCGHRHMGGWVRCVGSVLVWCRCTGKPGERDGAIVILDGKISYWVVRIDIFDPSTFDFGIFVGIDFDLWAGKMTTSSALTRGIPKHSQKAKTAKVGIKNRDRKRGNQVGSRMTCLSHSHIKTYDGSEDPEDHLKIFQAAANTEWWAMPTWCHMFNSMLTGNARVWFDDLPPESIDSYDDLKKAFLKNYLQQKKYIKDHIELHNIKQRDGESTKDFVRTNKLESRDVKGASECMRISGFVHRITNPELIKHLHDKILKMVDEMIRVTTSFLRGKWQPRIMRGRSRSHYGDSKRVIRNKVLENEISKTSRGRKGSRIGSRFS